MRWKTKIIPDFKEGDTRVVRKFLLLPLWFDNEWRWLEYAFVKQRYCRWWRSDINESGLDWYSIGWADEQDMVRSNDDRP